MKKYLSLILVFCLAMASVPALAEDCSGTWYFLMMGMTAGTLELNADGTMALTMDSGNEGNTRTGTWAQGDNNVTLTVEGQSMVLAYDGSTLKLDASSFEVLGLNADSMGVDASMLDALIQLSREPGTITLDEFTAYSENGTIPEGKTEQEMMAIQMKILSLVFGLMGDMPSDVSFGAGSALTEAMEVTILEENFYVRKNYGGQPQGFYIAKVQNQNDAPLTLSEVSFILKDAAGNEVGKAEYFNRVGSRYLEPGEVTYVTLEADVKEGATPESYEVSLKPSSFTYGTDVQLEAVNPELRQKDDYGWITWYAAATITNTGDAPLSQANVAIVIRDSSGKLLDLAQTGLYQHELAVGSTITLLDSIDSITVDYCTENGIEFGGAEALAWAEIKD